MFGLHHVSRYSILVISQTTPSQVYRLRSNISVIATCELCCHMAWFRCHTCHRRTLRSNQTAAVRGRSVDLLFLLLLFFRNMPSAKAEGPSASPRQPRQGRRTRYTLQSPFSSAPCRRHGPSALRATFGSADAVGVLRYIREKRIRARWTGRHEPPLLFNISADPTETHQVIFFYKPKHTRLFFCYEPKHTRLFFVMNRNTPGPIVGSIPENIFFHPLIKASGH